VGGRWRSAASHKANGSTVTVQDALHANLYNSTVLNLSSLDRATETYTTDPLPDEYFEKLHRRAERQEKQLEVELAARGVRSLGVGGAGARLGGADDRRRTVDDRQQGRRDLAPILVPPHAKERGAPALAAPKRVESRSAEPQRELAGLIDFDDEAVGEQMTNGAGIDVVAIGSGARAAQPVPISVKILADGMSHTAPHSEV